MQRTEHERDPRPRQSMVSPLIGLSPVSMLTRVKSPKSDFQVGKSCSSLSKLKLKVCYELIMTFGIQISAAQTQDSGYLVLEGRARLFKACD